MTRNRTHVRRKNNMPTHTYDILDENGGVWTARGHNKDEVWDCINSGQIPCTGRKYAIIVKRRKE